ncbi:MAG: hypothetical protein OXF77_00935 [Thaumarchaeota archaeon]|nr:hypothetical protein [Nitrososphaerota archaeon]
MSKNDKETKIVVREEYCLGARILQNTICICLALYIASCTYQELKVVFE